MITSQQTDTIPFCYSTSGHIVIEAQLANQSKKNKFILDCGASNMIFTNRIPPSLLQKNGFGIGIGAKGNFFTTRIKQLESLTLGTHKFEGINVKQTDFNIDCSDDICGLIGTGIMHKLEWQIDFKKQVIYISNNTQNFNHRNNLIRVPLRLNQHSNHLSTAIQFRKHKKKHWVLIDLGNNGTLNLNEKTLVKDSVDFLYKCKIGKGANVLGKTDSKETNEKIYLADSIYFASDSLMHQNIPIETSPGGLNLLGLGFFKKYKTTISWQKKELLLEPYETTQTFTWETTGFSLYFDNETKKTRIGTVIEDTPAYCTNITPNLEVISINGHKFPDEESYCQYRNQIDNSLWIELVVMENGSPKKYNFEKAPIFE